MNAMDACHAPPACFAPLLRRKPNMMQAGGAIDLAIDSPPVDVGLCDPT